MNINKSGLWGEIYAARYLRDNGYDIIAGNYRCKMGEIDIIAQKNGIISFVEVKTRGENPMFRPMEAVDIHKQRRLIATAKYYMGVTKEEYKSQFDVIEIILDEKFNLVSVNHIKNAI